MKNFRTFFLGTSLLLMTNAGFAGIIITTSGVGAHATASGLGTNQLSGQAFVDISYSCPQSVPCDLRGSADLTIDATTPKVVPLDIPVYLDLTWSGSSEWSVYPTGIPVGQNGEIVGMFSWGSGCLRFDCFGQELIPYTLGTPFQIRLSAEGAAGCVSFWTPCVNYYVYSGGVAFDLSVRVGSPTGGTVPIVDAVPEPGGLAGIGLLMLVSGKLLLRRPQPHKQPRPIP
jgi:hypothetical protein